MHVGEQDEIITAEGEEIAVFELERLTYLGTLSGVTVIVVPTALYASGTWKMK